MFMNFVPCIGRCRLMLLALALACSGGVLADTVLLKNGDRLTGEIDSIAGGRLLLKTGYAGRLPIKLDAVELVTSKTVLRLRLRQGGHVQGRLGVIDSVQHLLGADDESRLLDLTTVTSASRGGNTLAELVRGWSTEADLSASLSSGNSETEALNVLVHSTLTLERSEHDGLLLVSREEADGVRTKEQLDFDYGYKRYFTFTDKWFALGNAEYYRDELKDIDLRITLGGGIGYQAWRNSLGALSLGTGASVVFDELGTKAAENPAWRWELDYNRFFRGKQLELFHRHSLLVIPNSGRGEIIEASTGLRFAINDRLDTILRVDHRIDTKPPEGAEKTDVSYNLGVGFKL